MVANASSQYQGAQLWLVRIRLMLNTARLFQDPAQNNMSTTSSSQTTQLAIATK